MESHRLVVKKILLFFLAFVVFLVAWMYVNRYVIKPRAVVGPNGVEFSFSNTNKDGSTIPVATNATTTVSITPKTATNHISGYDLSFVAAGNLEFVDVVGPAGFTQVVKTVAPKLIRASFVNPTTDSNALPTVVQFQISFKGVSAGAGSIRFEQTPVYDVVGPVTGGTYEVDTNPPVGEFTFGAGSSTTGLPVTMKIKFQGITSKPRNASPIAVRVKAVDKVAGVEGVEQFVNFTSDDAGVYSGQTNIDVPVGSNYTIYLKGHYQLGRRFCDIKPSETVLGSAHCTTGTIPLNTSGNSFDFTGLSLLAGDLPEQDGVVDSRDLSFIRQHLASTKQEDIDIGDINRDNIVDTQDMSLIFQALTIKFDEE